MKLRGDGGFRLIVGIAFVVIIFDLDGNLPRWAILLCAVAGPILAIWGLSDAPWRRP